MKQFTDPIEINDIGNSTDFHQVGYKIAAIEIETKQDIRSIEIQVGKTKRTKAGLRGRSTATNLDEGGETGEDSSDNSEIFGTEIGEGDSKSTDLEVVDKDALIEEIIGALLGKNPSDTKKYLRSLQSIKG